jgi:integrase
VQEIGLSPPPLFLAASTDTIKCLSPSDLRSARGLFHPPIELPTVANTHDLRHTAASILLRNRIPAKVVQGMLGHTTISMTLDICSHVLPDMQQQAAASLDQLLASSQDEDEEAE